MDKGFIFDYAKCVGCHACLIACFNENKPNPPLSWRKINSYNSQKIPIRGFIHLSLACNHCDDAPCLKGCPASAYRKDPTTNAVIHNPNRCIGCKYCTWVCPFDAPRYNSNTRIIEKCNFCNHLLSDGKIPACANNCPTGALAYGNINVNESIDSKGLPMDKTYPRINTIRDYIINSIPIMHQDADYLDELPLIKEKLNLKISALEEWPLVIFTLIVSILSGWLISSKLNLESSLGDKLGFLALGIFGAGLSSFHLGKPSRSIFSLTNIKSSWLSREILFFSIFIAISACYILIINLSILYYIAVVSSILLLVSIEFVYISFEKSLVYPNSASTVFTTILFAFLFSNQENLLLIVLILKLTLYSFQILRNSKIAQIRLLSIFRILFGIFIPISILITNIQTYYLTLILPFLIAGELIDRYEFYLNLYVETPENILKTIVTRMKL